MASRPPELPESIVIGDFKGVRNTVSRERLAPGEFESAVNIDIDDVGQVRRRRGHTLRLTGNFHSLCTIGGRVLGVKDGELGQVFPDFTFTGFGTIVGPERLSYTQVDRATYFSSMTASGKLTGNTIEPWGAVDDAGRWVSPVITPTDALGELFGVQINAPPMAREITSYSGRIYLLGGKYLWATELFLYDYVQKTRNFFQFESEGTMLAAVSDGLYVGTEDGLYFLRGTLSQGMRIDKLLEGAVVRGSAVYIPESEVHPQAQQGVTAEALAVTFLTTQGICAGLAGGKVLNLTRGRVVFPTAQDAAAMHREDSGGSSYVVVTDSAGGLAANARIGDYVDAEIVRPSL
jgi:hypothetical protein